MTKKGKLGKQSSDHLTNEILVVLARPQNFSFNELFNEVYANLKEKNTVSGGEEMLRLRAYEKLQNLVNNGLANKENRKYIGDEDRILKYQEEVQAEINEENNKSAEEEPHITKAKKNKDADAKAKKSSKKNVSKEDSNQKKSQFNFSLKTASV